MAVDGKGRRVAATLAGLLVLVIVYALLDRGSQKPQQQADRASLVREEAETRPAKTPAPSFPTRPAGFDPDEIEAILAEYANRPTPVWGVEIDRVPPGAHRYWFYVDGEPLADPLNPPANPNEDSSIFNWPLPDDRPATNPRCLSSDRAFFICEGEIARSALFIAPFRDEWWGTDEFQPLNAAARANLAKLIADPIWGGVQGVVLDADRRPIPHARVRLTQQEYPLPTRPGPDHIQTAACDADGRFRLERLPRVEATATPRAAGYAESGYRWVTISSLSATPVLEFILTPTTLVAGSVMNEARLPIAGAEITARSLRWVGPRDWGDMKTSTAASGRYVFDRLAPGGYEFVAEAPGYCPALKTDIGVPKAGLKSPPEVDFVLKKGATVRGRVLQRPGAAGEPEMGIEGAEVSLQAALKAEKGVVQRSHGTELTASSGPGGDFLIENVCCGIEYQCWARLVNRISDERLRLLIEKDEDPPALVFHIPPPAGLSGRVLNSDKEPIARAEVQLIGAMQQTRFDGKPVPREVPFPPKEKPSVSTAADGRFVFEDIASGASCTVLARADGYVPKGLMDQIAGSDEETVIVLERGGTISGRVVEEGSEKPLPGLRVWYGVEEEDAGSIEHLLPPATTGKDGSFALDGLRAGMYGFLVKGSVGDRPYRHILLSHTRVAEGQWVQGVILRIPAGATIKGTVLTRESRKPVSGAYVSVMDGNLGQRRNAGSDAITADDGSFSVTGESGKRVVRVYKTGFAEPETAVAIDTKPGEVVEGLEILLDEGGAVSGIVIDENGDPVSGVWLCLKPKAARKQMSDFEGRFRFSGFPVRNVLVPEVYRVVTDLHGRQDSVPALSPIQATTIVTDSRGMQDYVGQSEPFRLTEEQPHAEVTVKVRRGASISGRVVDTEGEPISGATVSMIGPGHDYGLRFWTDGSAHYSFRGLESGTWKIQPWHAEYKLSQGQQVVIAEREDLEDVDLTLEKKEEQEEQPKPRHAIRGILLDIRERPLAGWQVSANGEPDQTLRTGQARTAPDGRFEIAGLSEGTYKTQFSFEWTDDDARSARFEVSGIEPVDTEAIESVEVRPFVIPLGAVVRGRLVYEGSKEPLPNAIVVAGYPPMDEKGRMLDVKSRPPDGVCACVGFGRMIRIRESNAGVFQFDAMPVETLGLAVYSSTTLPLIVQALVPDESLVADLGDVEVRAAHRIRMRLVDALTGKPHVSPNPHNDIHVWGGGPGGMPDWFEELWPGGFQEWGGPNEGGVLTLCPVPDNLTSLTIWCKGYFPVDISPIRLDPSGETDLGTILLQCGHRITGRFIDVATGKPPAGALQVHVHADPPVSRWPPRVTFESGLNNAPLGSDGRFSLRCVPDNIKRLAFFFQGPGVDYLNPVFEPVPLTPSKITDLGDIPLDRGWTVRGKITGPNGETVSRATIDVQVFEGEQPLYNRSSRTNSIGEFAVAGLPAGPAVLSAAVFKQPGDNNWIEGGAGSQVVLKDLPITVLPNDETKLDLRFPTATPEPPQYGTGAMDLRYVPR